MKTSEFYLTIVVIGAMTILACFSKLTPELVAAIGGPAGVYAISRGVAKHGNGGA